MNWFLFGAATSAAMSKDPHAGERMLDGLIYAVCYLLPLMPMLFAGSEKRAYEAIQGQLWAKVSIVCATLFGYAGLIYVGVAAYATEVSSPALLIALASLVWGLLAIRKAKKSWPLKYNLKEMVSRITPENKHDFSETDFGGPVEGRNYEAPCCRTTGKCSHNDRCKIHARQSAI